jgi:hypothetical protein
MRPAAGWSEGEFRHGHPSFFVGKFFRAERKISISRTSVHGVPPPTNLDTIFGKMQLSCDARFSQPSIEPIFILKSKKGACIPT